MAGVRVWKMKLFMVRFRNVEVKSGCRLGVNLNMHLWQLRGSAFPPTTRVLFLVWEIGLGHTLLSRSDSYHGTQGPI